MKYVKSLSVTLFGISLLSTGSVFATNERICSPMVNEYQVYVAFPKGAFAPTGDGGGFRTMISTRYDNNDRKGLLYSLAEGNVVGGSAGTSKTLCFIDQAKGVGDAATLIMAWGNGTDCNSWWGWAQVQSSVAYSGCTVNGNNITLE